MNLMGHQQVTVVYLQLLTQRLTILRNACCVVATIAIDIKLTIIALAIASLSGRAKGSDTVAKMIVMEYWFYHVLIIFTCKNTKKL